MSKTTKNIFKNFIFELLLFIPLFPLANFNPFLGFLGLVIVLFVVM